MEGPALLGTHVPGDGAGCGLHPPVAVRLLQKRRQSQHPAQRRHLQEGASWVLPGSVLLSLCADWLEPESVYTC